ncbi:MAG: AAA family ATPase [Desulfovibrionaceae bacterium]
MQLSMGFYMLTRLELQHFKCFKRLLLPLAPLTLLSGANASGKSSVLQALVLLNQTMREHEWSTRLMLNGNTIRLGVVSDVVDEIHGRRSCDIGISNENAYYQWHFSGERSEMSMGINRIKMNERLFEAPDKLRYLLPPDTNAGNKIIIKAIKELTYITAERVGPREIYNVEDRQVSSVVGPSGEHAVSVLNWGRDKQVPNSLTIQGNPPTLLRQVEARMQSFFPGCGIMLRQVPQANAVTLGMRTSLGTEFHRPIHVGLELPPLNRTPQVDHSGAAVGPSPPTSSCWAHSRRRPAGSH